MPLGWQIAPDKRVAGHSSRTNYQPSFLARSLRKQRTFTVGVLVPELSDGYHTLVMSGIGDRLTTIRQPLREMGETAARILLQRIQGFKDYPVQFAVPPELINRETTASPNPRALRRQVLP